MNNSCKDYENDSRKPCQYGSKCYRKSKDHQEKFKHPPSPKKNNEQFPIKKTTQNFKQKQLSFFFQKHAAETSKIEKVKNSTRTSSNVDTSKQSSSTGSQEKSSDCTAKEDTKHTTNIPDKIKDVEISIEECDRIIKELFYVRMPEDFYSFWSFSKSISSDNPKEALQSINLELVGPYDVLSGTLNEETVDRSIASRHWRYYYDPPEFQTVLRSTKPDLFHVGYFRDEPDSLPVFVAYNDASKDSIITSIGENLFGAVDWYIRQSEKCSTPFKKMKCSNIRTALHNWASKHNFTLAQNTDNMRKRDKNVVSRTFHHAGIVVPYNKKTELGYRPLSETTSNLNKLLKQIDETKTDEERKVHFSRLHEIVTWANIAMDEGDFGTSLELGIDLFSFGSHHLHKLVIQLLTSSYSLLGRNFFATIINVHLEDRKKGNQLSILSKNTSLDK